MFDNVKVTILVKRPGLGRIGRPISDVKTVFDGRQNIFAARQLPFAIRPLTIYVFRKMPPTPGRMMINVDVSATAFYESSDLVHMVAKILERNIRVTHRDDCSVRSFKILKLTDTSTSNTQLNFGYERIDIASYFQNTYNKPLQFPSLPYVVVRGNIFFPMEVCKVVEEQHYIRKYNERQTADITKFSCQPPHIRANKIKQGLLDYRQNEYMKQFGLIVSEEMAVVPTRILPAPRIRFHYSSRTAAFVPRDGSWNLRDKKVATGATWFMDTGMNIPKKNPPIIQGNHQVNLCILPNTGLPLYAEIKRVCDTIIGVATQCVQSKHIFQAKRQYCANLCLKMNVKLGGMNSFIEPSCIQFVTERPTIVMDASVTHAPGDDESRPSIAALCASVDAKASRYAASILVQAGRQEIFSDFSGMIKEHLKSFYQTCERKPESMLLYRKGISEGQFEQFLDLEIEAVRAACASLDANYKPSITFVVIQKRHHTRLFPVDKKDSDNTGNCPVGTVVESTITHPFEFDFYLQSHAGTRGTSRPMHYYVLYDENRFNADSLQTLSYNLCYSFARCTRAVSIVPPVYYAHLACSRVSFER
ncbi:1984_t:CDS:2 [Funneliformis caledonium]|uniref:1984_t:CDS:1 n=1 Tax=Funneliformis caledonium TaxID=1117310 RepID=A0A9N9GTT6_9GLOM|nr:1984_t:CDS:2 [Funneliformis caledonium]